jgi:hypothetical protein
MGRPGSASSELSAESSRHVNSPRCLEFHHHYDHQQTGTVTPYKKEKEKKKKSSKMPQYRPRKSGAAGSAFDDGTINGDYRRPRRIRKR